MLSKIEKLSLKRGDVLVCKDYETLNYLSKVQLPLGFVVPLVFAPQGLQALNRQDLLNLLEQLEQGDASTQGMIETMSAPL